MITATDQDQDLCVSRLRFCPENDQVNRSGTIDTLYSTKTPQNQACDGSLESQDQELFADVNFVARDP